MKLVEKQLIPLAKSGIHIKESNRGKFTDYCGGKVTSECINRGKNSSDPKIRKRATFAANARAWKHLYGGLIKKYDGDTINLYQNPFSTYSILSRTDYSFPLSDLSKSIADFTEDMIRPKRRTLSNTTKSKGPSLIELIEGVKAKPRKPWETVIDIPSTKPWYEPIAASKPVDDDIDPNEPVPILGLPDLPYIKPKDLPKPSENNSDDIINKPSKGVTKPAEPTYIPPEVPQLQPDKTRVEPPIVKTQVNPNRLKSKWTEEKLRSYKGYNDFTLLACKYFTDANDLKWIIRTAARESGFNHDVKNPHSSAHGYFLMVDSTWNSNGGGDRKSKDLQMRNMLTLMSKYKNHLNKYKEFLDYINKTGTNEHALMTLMHFIGMGDTLNLVRGKLLVGVQRGYLNEKSLKHILDILNGLYDD